MENVRERRKIKTEKCFLGCATKKLFVTLQEDGFDGESWKRASDCLHSKRKRWPEQTASPRSQLQRKEKAGQ